VDGRIDPWYSDAMSDPVIDVVGIGNAIVDVLSSADDSFLARQGLTKGAMTLIDAERATRLYEQMGTAVEASGGSAANTIAGIASLGGITAFIGKVKNDQLGEIFAHDIRALGVRFETPMAKDGAPTARSMILVTPDAQRTMNTYLGAAVTLDPGDVDEALIQSAKVTYLEGYLWDPPAAKEAFKKAMRAAHRAGRKVALTLSDAFCVDRFRAEFRDLVATEIDVLFANESEIRSLYEVDSFDAALAEVRKNGKIAALTRSEKGAVIVAGEAVHSIPAEPGVELVDTTGAGDQFAAGFLYGLTHGRDLATSGRIGIMAAAEVISHYGARPETSLAELLSRRGL
jgi:sugar/nucleoside kinase (ribokinase family)